MTQFGKFRARRRASLLVASWMLASLLLILLTIGLADHRAEADTIHDVVSSTWPSSLVSPAEQIAYHESGGDLSSGNCMFGMLPETESMLGISGSEVYDPYFCSSQAYRLYQMMGGWTPWVTAGMYTAGAGDTPVTGGSYSSASASATSASASAVSSASASASAQASASPRSASSSPAASASAPPPASSAGTTSASPPCVAAGWYDPYTNAWYYFC